MAKKVCFHCGKDMGEQEPYESKMTLTDICKKCKKILEKQHIKVKDFLFAGRL